MYFVNVTRNIVREKKRETRTKDALCGFTSMCLFDYIILLDPVIRYLAVCVCVFSVGICVCLQNRNMLMYKIQTDKQHVSTVSPPLNLLKCDLWLYGNSMCGWRTLDWAKGRNACEPVSRKRDRKRFFDFIIVFLFWSWVSPLWLSFVSACF